MIAIVCGGGEGVWDELRIARELVGDAEVVHIAVNDAIVHHPDPLHHVATLHAEKLWKWTEQRERAGLGTGQTRWGITSKPHIDRVVRSWEDGSSGLFAVGVALNYLDAAGVLLCGVPMDDRKNEFRGQHWGDHKRYRRGWRKALPELQGRVRSMSGWTREILGAPYVLDPKWSVVCPDGLAT